MLTITKVFEFSAAHRLADPKLTQAENERLFGNCASANFHGHNFTLEVTLGGTLDPSTQMIIDTRRLKTIVGELVIGELDHRNLNLDVPWLADRLPTTEAIAESIFYRVRETLAAEAPLATFLKVGLRETRTIYATCEGPLREGK